MSNTTWGQFYQADQVEFVVKMYCKYLSIFGGMPAVAGVKLTKWSRDILIPPFTRCALLWNEFRVTHGVNTNIARQRPYELPRLHR